MNLKILLKIITQNIQIGIYKVYQPAEMLKITFDSKKTIMHQNGEY